MTALKLVQVFLRIFFVEVVALKLFAVYESGPKSKSIQASMFQL